MLVVFALPDSSDLGLRVGDSAWAFVGVAKAGPDAGEEGVAVAGEKAGESALSGEAGGV